jgi:MFS family permease
MGIAGAPLGGFLSSIFGEKRWLLVVLSFACIFLGAAVNSSNTVTFILLYLLYVFCNTLAMSARSALMARLAPRRRRGLGYSLYFLPSSLMGVVAPLIASNTAESYGLTSIFFIALIAYVLGLAMLKFAVDVPRGQVE